MTKAIMRPRCPGKRRYTGMPTKDARQEQIKSGITGVWLDECVDIKELKAVAEKPIDPFHLFTLMTDKKDG